MNPDTAIEQLANYRRIEVIAAVSAVLFLILLVESIRRHRLKERYALLWFVTCTMVILLTIKRAWLESISYVLGIHYPPNALFLILVGFVIIILFHFSTVMSRLLDDRTAMAQRLAILEAHLHALGQEVARLRGSQRSEPENSRARAAGEGGVQDEEC